MDLEDENFIKNEIRIKKDLKDNIENLFNGLDVNTITAIKIDIEYINDNALIIADDNKNVIILIGNNISKYELDVLLIHELIHVTQDEFYEDIETLSKKEVILEIKTYISTIYYTLIYDISLFPIAIAKGLSGIISYAFYYYFKHIKFN